MNTYLFSDFNFRNFFKYSPIFILSWKISGVLSSSENVSDESFENNLLEYPQYTRPYDFMGLKVPDVLISGNHKKIDEWRKNKSLEETKEKRPDLIK